MDECFMFGMVGGFATALLMVALIILYIELGKIEAAIRADKGKVD